MVAVIKYGESLRNVVNYNENKVKKGEAECIGAANYPKDLQDLTFSNKLNRLTRQAALNERVGLNSIHISLNFHPKETISVSKLNKIADTYMRELGLDDLPYLVYKHNDAGHPHIHIVAVKVRANGDFIDMHNMGRNQSEKARKQIEIDFNLVKASDSDKEEHLKIQPVNVQKALYGKSQTKRAITTVLTEVLDRYKFASLPELNAILSLYNVCADQGTENSRVFKNRGLVYRILNDEGIKVGVPIKASDFYSKPTLSMLEGKFEDNDRERNRFKKGVRNAIDMHFHGKKHLSLEGLEQALKKQGISVVLRKNPTGQIYGITFVDHINKCVFNGRTLGPGYSIKSIQEKCEPTKVSLRPSTHVEVREVNIETNRRERRSNFGKFEPKQVSTKPKRKYDFSKTENIRPPFSMLNGYTSLGQPHHSPHGASDSKEGIFTILFEAYETDSQLPPELRASKSKKRYKKKRS